MARAVELQCMMLFSGWRYRLKEEHFAGKTATEVIKNKPPEVNRDKWNWLVNHWADPKQQVLHDRIFFWGGLRMISVDQYVSKIACHYKVRSLLTILMYSLL